MEQHPLIKRTFNLYDMTLPLEKEITKYLGNDFWKDLNKIFLLREEYIKYSYHILSEEFILSIKKTIDEFKIRRIIELCCGCGWLTHWLRRYGIPVMRGIDDFSWITVQRRYGIPVMRGIDDFSWITVQRKYLPFVEKEDAISCVKKERNTDLFILAWPPYDNPLATDIWNEMKEGQYLLYIGEDKGGCNADDSFFDLVRGKEVLYIPTSDEKEVLYVPTSDGVYNNIINFKTMRFYGLHDYASLFRKEKKTNNIERKRKFNFKED